MQRLPRNALFAAEVEWRRKSCQRPALRLLVRAFPIRDEASFS